MEISLNNALNNIVNIDDVKILADEKACLLNEIKKVKLEMKAAYNNFDYIEDALMIDYYTYQLKAYEAKFEYLIKKAKEIGLTGV